MDHAAALDLQLQRTLRMAMLVRDLSTGEERLSSLLPPLPRPENADENHDAR